jgi:superfamily I DNA and/or RNA helicase/very-short-patch-repair endonuclease
MENLSQISDLTQKIVLTIGAWKTKLLDLTKRNRALNFKPNKVSTVTIVDEHATEIFKLLCLQNKNLKFKAKPEDPVEKPSEAVADDTMTSGVKTTSTNFDDEFYEDDLPSPDFVPYDSTVLADQYTDDYLQTNAVSEKLDKSLRRLDEQARSSQEEQGVNSLFLALGMLQYSESRDSKEIYKAPLILVPVELERRSARAGYALKKSDDETILNPSLIEYLRRNYNIILPEIPDSNVITENYDLQTFFTDISESIKDRANWSVKDEIQLALFSFQKLVMYKDLEKNADGLAAHSIIKKVITRSGNHFAALPEEIREMELDRDFAPENTAQVVDADSSQLRAIVAVAKQHNLVLEGPPGTGKSQTITNLIAQSLSAGKSVLFVAEKMAALDVVHRRLVAAGLGEFCLELHSTKANKRSVMNEIRISLDASLQGIAVPQDSSSRLPVLRRELTEYTNAVHTPYGTIAQSPYRVFGELQKVLNAPKIVLQNDIFSHTQQQIDGALREAKDLSVAVEHIGSPAKHPWRDTTKTFYSENDSDQVEQLCKSLQQKLVEAIILALKIENDLGLPPIGRLDDIETALAIASVIARSPGAPMQVLSNQAWNTPPKQANDLIEKGRQTAGLRDRIVQNFTLLVFDLDPTDDILHVEKRSSGFFGFLAFLDSRYRTIKKRWTSYRLPNYEASLIEQANEMKSVAKYREEKKGLELSAAAGASLFGALWQGEASSWSALENYIVWVLDFRKLCVQHGLREQALTTASKSQPNLTIVSNLEKKATKIKTLLQSLCLLVGLPSAYFDGWAMRDIQTRVDELADNLQLAPRWAAFEEIRQRFEKSVMSELLPLAISEQLSFSDLGPAFKRAFYQKWLAQVVTERLPLRSFHTLTHEQRIREFQETDERVLKENRASLVDNLRERLQNALRRSDINESMRFLRGQLARQRGLAPVRITLKQSLPAIRAIKPCFMMSPQTVAQFLDVETSKFDLVIFDEASQLPTEEAAGAILRGAQLVVVGDPKQLPPTNFFAVQSGTVNIQFGEDGLPLYEDSQSILEEVMGAGVPQTRLKWHYRSAHESLINFSNVQFYDADLYTFPSVETNSLESGLHFEYVENGVYEGKGLNLIEARKVADAVVDHIKNKSGLTLGVGTFNLRQQLAIQDELEQRRRDDPSIEPFFDKGCQEPFFVKNLENIQGDERDVIFLSVTYAKAVDGKMRYNLGPLNGENGWRRLNVITTRARKLMRVFSSVRGDEINPASATSQGARLLKEFLTYAEHGRWDHTVVSTMNDTDSPFEREVFQELDRRGFKVMPQVGVCGYKIDLGILDQESLGRFICGIECDGVAYHSSETARDRDRLRQQVLEGRGWEIHRVWSTDWFKDRPGQIERLVNLIEQSRQNARKYYEREKERHEAQALETEKLVGEFLGETSNAEVANSIDSLKSDYARPIAEPYQLTNDHQVVFSQYLLNAPVATVAQAILTVIEKEAPVHIKDLATRVAAMWGQKSGNNIFSRIGQVCYALQQHKRLEIRGDFIWKPTGEFQVRSRNETNIPAERIAPEEVREAILQVLRAGQGFTRRELVNEVRAVFGFNRTGPSLQQVIDSAIEALLAKGTIGEGSLGIALRRDI